MDNFGIDLASVGALVGLFMLPGIVLAIPAGTLGGRFGDKRMVLFGLMLMAAGTAASGFAPDWNVMLAGRVLNGIGAVFLTVLMTKMVFD
jgi:MFS family permease